MGRRMCRLKFVDTIRKCCDPPLFLKSGDRRESGVTSILCNKISAQAEFISAEQVKLKFRVPKNSKDFIRRKCGVTSVLPKAKPWRRDDSLVPSM